MSGSLSIVGLLTSYGFNPCKTDVWVMHKTISRGSLVLTIHMDDLLLTS